MDTAAEVVLVGGSGHVGQELALSLVRYGACVTVLDRRRPTLIPEPALASLTWSHCDLLIDDVSLTGGRVVLLLAGGDRSPRWPWTLILDVVVTTARLLRALPGRDVLLVRPDTAQSAFLDDNAGPGGGSQDATAVSKELWELAAQPCPPSRVSGLCRSIVGAVADDPWATALGLQEQMLRDAAPVLGFALTVLSVPSQAPCDEVAYAVTTELLGSSTLVPASRCLLAHTPLFDPPLPVVIPPKPVRPEEVARRQQAVLWSGELKSGNRWSTRLGEELAKTLQLCASDRLLTTTSGTAALLLAIVATVGRAEPGDLAVVPSFTFRATVDVLLRLGYGLRYVDVDPWSWTLDPSAVSDALSDERVKLVVCVDTFGNPCAYDDLLQVCRRHAVALVADSAAGFGSKYKGAPVGVQADAHSFSMSFAKVLTAAGAGGAVVLRGQAAEQDLADWVGSSLMGEVHAIAALDQLAVLDDLVERRNQVAAAYKSVADELGGYVTQEIAPGNQHSFVHWVAEVTDRQSLAAQLAELGVMTKPYFPAQHLHHPPSAGSRTGAGRLPVTERLDRRALAFPTSSELSARQRGRVCEAMRRCQMPSARTRWGGD